MKEKSYKELIENMTGENERDKRVMWIEYDWERERETNKQK